MLQGEYIYTLLTDYWQVLWDYCYLLSVSTICHGLVVIVLKNYMTEVAIRNVLDDVPLYCEASIPLVLLPVLDTFPKIDRANHLRHTTELPTCIDLCEGRTESNTQRVGKRL
jgi:hypothetical protein